jgi:histidine triad (HIT) family protein
VRPAGIHDVADSTLQIHFPLATRNVKLETRVMSDFEPGCLFCRVIKGDAPSKKVYEDDRTYAFHDTRPQAPTHVLIVPKKHIRGLKEATAEDSELLGYCHVMAAKIARERGIEDGYRTVLNVGPGAGQSVFHLHVHLIGGRHLGWPPG